MCAESNFSGKFPSSACFRWKSQGYQDFSKRELPDTKNETCDSQKIVLECSSSIHMFLLPMYVTNYIHSMVGCDTSANERKIS